MTNENSDISAASPAGQSTASAAPNTDTSTATSTTSQGTDPSQAAAASGAQAQGAAPGAPGTPGAPTPPAYTPNYKYKAAGSEKELDKFWHPLIKDSESEKQVKELFSKADAAEFQKTRREQAEQAFSSMATDYEQTTNLVKRFNQSVQQKDLSSAFRLANISKEDVFTWTQQQLQLLEMPPEQRQQHEQFEAAKTQKMEMEDKYTQLQQQYETTAVQTRVLQLDVALSRPEVANFAQAWDQNAGQDGAFKSFVIEEAKKVYYDRQQDISPEQAIQMVMQRFGKFLNVGGPTTQSPQAIPQGQRQNPPVIPHVAGKNASPVKKVYKSLDELKKLSKEVAG